MPGSRLRSDIDMRRGESAGLPGEELPSGARPEVRIGTPFCSNLGAYESCSWSKSSSSSTALDSTFTLVGSECCGSSGLRTRLRLAGVGRSATSKDVPVGVDKNAGLNSSFSMIPCKDLPRAIGTG